MLTQVDAYNALGQKLELPLDILSSGAEYVIKSIDNLGPVKADITLTKYATMAGGTVQNTRTNERNPVFKVGYNPDWVSTDDPYGDLRRALYPWFTPESPVELHFHDTKLGELKLTGFVESMEPEFFSADPMVQISIIAGDPYFYALAPLTVGRSGEGAFTFTNPGSANSGFVYTLYDISAVTPGLTLSRTTPLADAMHCGMSLYMMGNRLAIQWVTIKGQKTAGTAFVEDYHPGDILVGTVTIGYIDKWLEVLPGVNTFDIEVMDSGALGTMVSTLVYTPRYVGL